jgi:hypothetical protein
VIRQELPLSVSEDGGLAAELAALEIDWQETDPEKVVVGAPDQEKMQALLRLYAKLTGA